MVEFCTLHKICVNVCCVCERMLANPCLLFEFVGLSMFANGALASNIISSPFCLEFLVEHCFFLTY
jgi:hypothetical protein